MQIVTYGEIIKRFFWIGKDKKKLLMIDLNSVIILFFLDVGLNSVPVKVWALVLNYLTLFDLFKFQFVRTFFYQIIHKEKSFMK